MRKFALVLVLLLCCVSVSAATEITLQGPDTAEVGETVRFKVGGLPEVDLQATIGDALAWYTGGYLSFELSAPAGSTAIVDPDFSITGMPARWRGRIDFVPTAPGAHSIFAVWRYEGAFQTIVHRVEVGPPPDPEPDPEPLENPFPAPSPEARHAVGPILKVPMSRADANRLAGVYEAAAKEVEVSLATRAAGVVPDLATTHDLNQLLTEETKQLDMQGRYSGLGVAVDSVATELLGAANRNVGDNDPPALRAMGWAIWEAGK